MVLVREDRIWRNTHIQRTMEQHGKWTETLRPSTLNRVYCHQVVGRVLVYSQADVIFQLRNVWASPLTLPLWSARTQRLDGMET